MITIRLKAMLNRLDEKFPQDKPRTLYWLQKETGISASTIWRLSKRQPKAIEFAVLERLCRALQCKTGDLLVMVDDGIQLTKSRRAKA